MTIDEIRRIHYEQKGEEKGAILSRREDILDNLKELGTLTEDLVKRINNEEDISILKSWVKISARVSSLQEFEALVKI